MKWLRRLFALLPAERRLLILAWSLLALIRMGLLLLPFRSLCASLARLAGEPKKKPAANSLSPERVAWAVKVASRRVPGGENCLVQALAVQFLLTRRGYEAELLIGVAKGELGELEAHAWVETEGRIVIGGQESPSRFTPFPHLEGKRS